jgi:hypothetical protein
MVSVFDIRTQSNAEKNAVVEAKYGKPVTNTSGTAQGDSNKFQGMADRFSAAMGAGVNPLEAAMVAMNPSHTATRPGRKPYNYYEQQFKKDVRAGKYANPAPAPKTTTSGQGLNAPPPDVPWQPSFSQPTALSGLETEEERRKRLGL